MDQILTTVIQMHSVPIMEDHSAVPATQDISEMVKLVQVINLFTYSIYTTQNRYEKFLRHLLFLRYSMTLKNHRFTNA